MPAPTTTPGAPGISEGLRPGADRAAHRPGPPGPGGSSMSRSDEGSGGRLTARELSPSTWPDFERLFRKYHGVQAGCWCMFYHRDGPNGPVGDPVRQEANRRDHRELVRLGRAHGVLVYRDGAAVGWCQFGRREELPRIDHGRKYQSIAGELGAPPTWRVTCFFVDRPQRRSGVARQALRAALEAIGRRGGGIVEAYPATHGRAVATWFGTVGMFEREGFRVVRSFGQSNLLVRREVPGETGSGSGRAPKTVSPSRGPRVAAGRSRSGGRDRRGRRPTSEALKVRPSSRAVARQRPAADAPRRRKPA